MHSSRGERPSSGAVFCKFHEILHCSVSKFLTKTTVVSIFCVSKLDFFQICFIMSYNVIIIQFKRDLMSFETDGAVKKYDRITSLLPQANNLMIFTLKRKLPLFSQKISIREEKKN